MSAANVLYHNFNLRHSCYGVVSHIDETEVHSRHSATQELARTLANRASDEFERLDTRLNAARDLVALLKTLATPTESEMEINI